MFKNAPNSLKKYTCLEWKVPLSGGKSKKFLLENQECLFNFCKTFTPENIACYSLYIQSESKIPLSFEVEVQVVTFTDSEADTYIPPTDDTTVEGIAPYLIWEEAECDARDLSSDGILLFNVAFDNVSDVEFVEDANAQAEVRPQTSGSENQQISLKKMTCLEWIFCAESPPYYPRYRTSPKFVINNQACSFALIKQTGRSKDKCHFTLAIDSEECDDVPQDFRLAIFVDWYENATTFEGTVTVNRIPLYNVWKSQQEYFSDIERIRLFFPSNQNVNLIEDADEKTSCGTSLRSLSSDLGKLLLSNDSKPDITIQCGECTIPAHRNILATRSEVLKKKMAESDSGILHIKDMEASVCRKFIEYLYTASVTDLSVKLALSLHEAGKMYGVDSLQRWCCDFLIRYLSDNDVPRDILDNDDILNSSQWACFTESQPKLVIQVLQRAYKKAKYV